MRDSKEELFFHWSDSLQKFDYYVTGLVGASLVYLIQTYRPARLGLNPPTIELAALSALIVSLFAGIGRIERNIAILRISHDLAWRETWLLKLRTRRSGQKIETTDGKVLSEDEIEAEIQSVGDVVAQAKRGREGHLRTSDRFYWIRNFAAILALALLLVARLAEAYYPLR